MKNWIRYILITLSVGGGFTGMTVIAQMLGMGQFQLLSQSVIAGLFFCLYAFVVWSGLVLVKNPRKIWPIMIALIIQVPVISSPLISYRFFSGAQIMAGLLGFKLNASANFGSSFFLGFFYGPPWGLCINILPLVLGGILLYQVLGQSKEPPNQDPTLPEPVSSPELAQADFSSLNREQ